MNRKSTDHPVAVRSRKALAHAFVELLSERSMEQITIEDITGRAGLSRQTFYTNFSKKEDILENSLKELFVLFLDGMSETPPTVERMLVVYFRFWNEHRTFLSVLFKNGFSYVFARDNLWLFQNRFSVYARDAAKVSEEIPYLESFLSGLTFQMLRTWQQSGWDRPVDEIITISCKLLRGEYPIEKSQIFQSANLC